MAKNYKHSILFLLAIFLWTKEAYTLVPNKLCFTDEHFTISSDTLIGKTIDSVKGRNSAVFNPLMERWQTDKSTKKPLNTSTFKDIQPGASATKSFKSFPQLDNYTRNLYVPPSDGKAEFTPEYVQSLFKVDNKTQEVLDAGAEVMAIIEQNQRFIDIITGQEVIDLPVGIKQDISDNSYITLGIISMEYHPNYTVVDIFAKVKLGELNAELFFGANDVKISREGGIYDEARLNLLADFPVGQNGGQWLLTFKGGLNEQGGGDGQTYITINCEGKIKEMAFTADVRIAKSVAVPLNEDGKLKYPNKVTPGTGENPTGNDSYVGASFSIKAASLEDLLIELDLPHFQLKALPNWGFKMEQTVFDLSDTKNAEGIVFPDIYRRAGLLQGNDNLWRGFHAKEVKVMLPPEFKKKGSEKRIIVGAKDLFIDNFGVSGDFYATNVLGINEGDASKWQFSVDEINVDLKVNQFVKAGFKGEIVLPISDNDASGKGQLGYEGIISADQHYAVQVDITKDVDFSIFKAKGKLQRGSYIKLEVENNRFYPEANLTGQMAFNAKQEGQLDGATDADNGIIEATKKIEIGKNLEFFAEDILTLKSNGTAKESIIIFATNENGQSGVLDVFEVDAKDVFKEGIQPGKIYNQNPRPQPADYLIEGYIVAHLEKFNQVAVRFTTQSNIDKYGTLGGNESFVIPKSEFDNLISETAGNIEEIEKKSGLRPGDLSTDDTVIAIIEKEDFNNIKIPTGNENGANEFWIPGGKTSGGMSEATLNLSNSNLNYTVFSFDD